MKPQEYRQQIAYHERNKLKAIEGIANAKLNYAKANAPYPIGTKLVIDDRGKKFDVKIKAYTVEEDLSLSPVFETLEGKNIFLSKPVIIK